VACHPFSNTLYKFNDLGQKEQTWTELRNIPGGLGYDPSIVAINQQSICIFGGSSVHKLFIFNMESQTWSIENIPQEYQDCYGGSANVCWDDVRKQLHIIAGLDKKGHVLWSEDHGRSEWRQKPDIPSKIGDVEYSGLHGASCVWNPCGKHPNQIWMIGGRTQSFRLCQNILVFDTATDSYSLHSLCLPVARYAMGLAVLCDFVVLIGGLDRRDEAYNKIYVISARADDSRKYCVTTIKHQWISKAHALRCVVLKKGGEIHATDGDRFFVARLQP